VRIENAGAEIPAQTPHGLSVSILHVSLRREMLCGYACYLIMRESRVGISFRRWCLWPGHFCVVVRYLLYFVFFLLFLLYFSSCVDPGPGECLRQSSRDCFCCVAGSDLEMTLLSADLRAENALLRVGETPCLRADNAFICGRSWIISGLPWRFCS